MNYNHPTKNNSTVTIRVMCAIVFVLFSFSWLYFFQADVLATVQHVLSGGMTSYNALAGSAVMTIVLLILQLIIFFITRLTKRFHALTYLPSMLLLAILTDVDLQADGSLKYGVSWHFPVIVLLVWLPLVWIARLYQEIEESASYSYFSRLMVINLATLALMIIFVARMGNTNAVFHYRTSMEAQMVKGDFASALKVGDRSLESDHNLLMLRMYALARENALSERLFDYPVTGSASQMLPTNGTSRMLLYPVDSLYRFMGARPARKMEPMLYLRLLERQDSVVPRQVADYYLCGLLIDRQIDRFAKDITRYYPVDEHLPRHYREALTLYTHLRSHPSLVYKHPVTEENWNNLQELESRYPDRTERKGKVFDLYGNTYWYYYEYGK